MKKAGKRIIYYFISCLFLLSQQALASELTVLRGNEDYPPDEMHIDGKLTGFHIELIQNTADSISLPVKFESIPWKRAIQMLKNGERDALSYVSKNAAREKYALFLTDNILSETDYHFVINKSRNAEIIFNGNPKDLSSYTIGIQRGYVYSEEFDASIFKNTVYFNSVKQMTSLISTNRIDLGILASEEYRSQKDHEKFKDIKVLSPAFTTASSYLAFSNKNNINKKAEIFANAMRAYKKTDAYQALKRKYNK